MSSIFRIKEGFSTYTDTEKRLAEYILSNRDEILEDSAQVLGEKVNTSAAAVVRFAKKLGFKGFTAFKVELAKDTSVEEVDFDDIIKEEDSMNIMEKKAQAINQKNLEQTYKLINPQVLEDVIEKLITAETIYLFGVGGSGIVCDDFQNKLIRINKRVLFHKDPHIQLAAAAHINNRDVAIGISYTGNTKEVTTALSHASAIGAYTVGITQMSKSKLSKICSSLLYVPTEEKELRLGAILSRNSSLIITDLLYYGITKSDIDQSKESLKTTRSIIEELR